MFLLRNFRLKVEPRKFKNCPRSKVSRAETLVLKHQGANIRPIVPRHKHCIIFTVQHWILSQAPVRSKITLFSTLDENRESQMWKLKENTNQKPIRKFSRTTITLNLLLLSWKAPGAPYAGRIGSVKYHYGLENKVVFEHMEFLWRSVFIAAVDTTDRFFSAKERKSIVVLRAPDEGE